VADVISQFALLGRVRKRDESKTKKGGFVMRTALAKGWPLGFFCSILFVCLFGCATVPPKVEKLPPFHGFAGVKWGASIEEARKVAEAEGKKVFEDRTHKTPFAFYASGTYLNSPVIFSYFFTPKSKKLYRVDLTFRDLKIHKKALEDLVGKFGQPSYSQPDVDHWSWTDKTLVILQRESGYIQIAYLGGKWAELNHQETNGMLQ
jgi:hypothetical protein